MTDPQKPARIEVTDGTLFISGLNMDRPLAVKFDGPVVFDHCRFAGSTGMTHE